MQLVMDLLVPGIIAGVSCYGMVKGVDVYDALLQGAAKGLEILLRILPALVTLLTVVAMLRASGALELAAQWLAPRPAGAGDSPGDGGPYAGAAHQRQRRPGGGVGAHHHLRPRLHHRPHGGGDAGVHGDHLLYHRRLLRRGGDQKTRYAVPAAPVRGFGGVLFSPR